MAVFAKDTQLNFLLRDSWLSGLLWLYFIYLGDSIQLKFALSLPWQRDYRDLSTASAKQLVANLITTVRMARNKINFVSGFPNIRTIISLSTFSLANHTLALALKVFNATNQADISSFCDISWHICLQLKQNKKNYIRKKTLFVPVTKIFKPLLDLNN